MRLGIVCGHVVLNRSLSSLQGTRFLMVEPVTAENLAARNGKGGGKALVVADHLAPDRGQMIAFVEGREGANAYWPESAPVDAYCALIVKDVDFPLLPDEHTLPGTEVYP
jgi:microcompartment protein CcmK/EutM